MGQAWSSIITLVSRRKRKIGAGHAQRCDRFVAEEVRQAREMRFTDCEMIRREPFCEFQDGLKLGSYKSGRARQSPILS